jgi:hypothetical protein
MKARFRDRLVLRATALSWIAWLLAVGVFAAWTLYTYRAPRGPTWFGMTVHTAVFAIWTLLARDWFGLWLARRSGGSDLERAAPSKRPSPPTIK